MPKIIKPGKVCIILAGRHAGKKAVILQGKEEGSKLRNYPYAIVAGVDRYPRKVTKRMGAKKVAKRSKVKPFVQAVNYNHLMPTRYALELESLKGSVTDETLREDSQKLDAKKNIKKVFESKYTTGANKWFFQPLRF
ncbi:putative 60S large subunit ribosomal protein L27 [Cystobasidium minutum MCA 4210]|uniref:60S ribosomal protein eL27 n=1 Tax=Cystobasidium minutum MCA 4210 TaxID=1397322 RepID=UPI0034CDA619|eukprot:jgi/Rhomi1/72430/CE72429_4463